MSDLLATSPADALGLATQSYEEFLEDIKGRIRSAQARAARAINAELIEVYRQIGLEILRHQQEEGPELGRRTRGVVQRLSADLRAAFPGARGYSLPNLYRMRSFAAAWPDPEGLSDRVRDLPWGHVAVLVAETDAKVRDWYVERAGAWSRAQLEAAIASRLHEREGAAITNFERAPLSAAHAARERRERAACSLWERTAAPVQAHQALLGGSGATSSIARGGRDGAQRSSTVSPRTCAATFPT